MKYRKTSFGKAKRQKLNIVLFNTGLKSTRFNTECENTCPFPFYIDSSE